MRVFRIVADAAMGLILGGFLYAVVSWLMPRLEGPLTLVLLLAGSVIAVLVRYPDVSTRVLARDVNDLVTPGLVKVLMAWIAAIVVVAILALTVDLAWQIDLPRWVARTVLVVAFGAWFVPDLRRWMSRRGSL